MPSRVPNMRLRREQLGFTQLQLAQKIGTSQNIISEYESSSGKGHPRAEFLVKAASALSCSTDYLLGISDDPRRAGDPLPPEVNRLVGTLLTLTPVRQTWIVHMTYRLLQAVVLYRDSDLPPTT